MHQGKSDVLRKGCAFPSMSLTPGSACSSNSPETSSGLQQLLCTTNESPCRRQRALDLGSCLCAADSW